MHRFLQGDNFVASGLSRFLLLTFGWAAFLGGQGLPTQWTIDAARSRLTVKVLPAGLLASTLHTHFFQPTDWSGEVAWDPNQPGSVKVGVRIGAESLRDHQPKLSAKDTAKVERQVQSAEILDSAKYPKIAFEAGQVEAGQPPSGDTGEFRGTLAGTLTLHGQSRPLKFPFHGKASAERLEANATAAFKQSDFGIKPYSTALGAIAVKDEITIEIALVAVPRK